MPGPQTYTHRPTRIQAIQFLPENHADLRKWLTGQHADFEMTDTHLLISTLEGDRDFTPGYWIVKGTHGEWYGIAPDIFKTTYFERSVLTLVVA